MRSDLRRVFVSHSSRDPYADKVRRAVCRQLREKNYVVLVDADELKPGQEWRAVLAHWLAECHAAVVLVSRDALRSDWVRREMTILMWRRSLGSGVHVIPALVGDVTPRELRDAGLTDMRSLQYAREPSPGATDEDAEHAATTITSQLAALPPDTAENDRMRNWVDRISYFLTRVGEPAKLGECAAELGVAEKYLHMVQLPEGGRFLAHQLLDDALGRRMYNAIRAISDYMRREWLGKLISDVSFTWVNVEAARQLLAVCSQPKGAMAVLNARSSATADEYLDRATCRGGYWREVAGTVVGEDAVAELVAHYERAIASLHGLEPPWQIGDIQPRDEPCVLIVDPVGVRIDAVATALRIVRRRYPWIVFVLLAGEEAPLDQEVLSWRLGEVQSIIPPLQAGQEQAGRRGVRDLRALLAR
jgi:hypothetical protein